METYKLNDQDIRLINCMTVSLGGYLNIKPGTFNCRIGPSESIKIIHYGYRYGASRRTGWIELVLEHDMDFDIIEPRLTDTAWLQKKE